MDNFKQGYKSKYDESPNIFSLLGDEVGLILSYCLQQENSIPYQIGNYFSNKTLFTSRGELRFSEYYESIPLYFKLRKFQSIEDNHQNKVIEVIDSSFSDIIYKKMEELPYTGWKNPYICT
jgi:branched-chain amino acid transport system substrate-binding protein